MAGYIFILFVLAEVFLPATSFAVETLNGQFDPLTGAECTWWLKHLTPKAEPPKPKPSIAPAPAPIKPPEIPAEMRAAAEAFQGQAQYIVDSTQTVWDFKERIRDHLGEFLNNRYVHELTSPLNLLPGGIIGSFATEDIYSHAMAILFVARQLDLAKTRSPQNTGHPQALAAQKFLDDLVSKVQKERNVSKPLQILVATIQNVHQYEWDRRSSYQSPVPKERQPLERKQIDSLLQVATQLARGIEGIEWVYGQMDKLRRDGLLSTHDLFALRPLRTLLYGNYVIDDSDAGKVLKALEVVNLLWFIQMHHDESRPIELRAYVQQWLATLFYKTMDEAYIAELLARLKVRPDHIQRLRDIRHFYERYDPTMFAPPEYPGPDYKVEFTPEDRAALDAYRTQVFSRHMPERETPSSIRFRNEEYRVVQYLGSGSHSHNYEVVDSKEIHWQLKVYRNEQKDVHYSLTKFQEVGLPTIIPQGGAQKESSTYLYRFVRGLSVHDILNNNPDSLPNPPLPLDLVSKVFKAYQNWLREAKQLAPRGLEDIDSKNVLLDFKTGRFYLSDPF